MSCFHGKKNQKNQNRCEGYLLLHNPEKKSPLQVTGHLTSDEPNGNVVKLRNTFKFEPALNVEVGRRPGLKDYLKTCINGS